MFRLLTMLFSVIVVGAAPMAMAQETTIYEYDALGRLVSTSKSGGPADGEEKAITYDAAGNRTNYTVTGVVQQPDPVGSGSTNVIVLPINGFLVIPITPSQ